jgi:Holliday junction DNA helicase, RuvB subunit
MTIIQSKGQQLPDRPNRESASDSDTASSPDRANSNPKEINSKGTKLQTESDEKNVESSANQAASRGRSTVLSASETNSDRKSDIGLRPELLDEYIGQTRLKGMLTMSIAAARSRKEPLDHVLLYGPPGLGKTTLAKVIANEMNARIHMTSGPSLERPRDIVGLVHQLEAGDVLFIDEIHRLNKIAEELLYPAIEDFVIDLTSGKGHATRTMRLPLPKFTLIGATTKAGRISKALRDRFGFSCRLEFYDLKELSSIVARTSALLNVAVDDKAVKAIAARARGTPRIANRLVRLVRDFGQFQGKESIDEACAVSALESYQVDVNGLDNTDRKFLEILIQNYNGGPVGIDTIAATLGEDSETLEDVYEPFLIQSGFIQRTPRGRMATAKAYKHLGMPVAGQLSLNLADASFEGDLDEEL